MRFLRFSAILTAAAILFVLFNNLDFTDRGFRFSLRTSEDASASGGDYDIKSLSIFSKCVGFIRSNYINPSSIDPRQALLGALKGVQAYIPEMTMRVERAENGDLEKIRVGIGNQAKIFPVNDISDLYEMNWKFSDIMNFIAPGIPSSADSRKVEVAAINSMLRELDEHSIFLDEEMYGEMKLDTQGKFGGLGIVITSEDGYIVVVSVLEDTPAFGAGLKTRDVIIQIGEESTVNMPLTEAVSRLRGEPDTYVAILVQRKGWSEPKNYMIKRDIIAIKSITSKHLGNGIGYLKIKHFQQETDSELREHISKLKKFGKLAGLILDLRGNPGGLLDQAIQVSDIFLDEGVIVITEGKGSKEREVASAKKSRSITDIPLVVLVNGGSASASEIVAGALKNNNRAVIVGNRTFGKGTVQVLYEIGEAALKLTVAQYLTPGEISIQRVGIMPDIISIPVAVDSGRVTLFNYDALPRDTEDKKRGKRLKAIGHLSEDKPEYELRYLESSDGAKSGSSGSDDSDEEEINPEKSVIDREAFKKDFQISLAEAILSSGLSDDREKMLSSAGSVIKSLQMIEENKISTALEQTNIRWKEQGKNGKPDIAGALVIPGKKEALVMANEEITLQLTLKNNSGQPVYRLHALTESENPFFNEREFVFGKINPGEEKSYGLKLKIPRDQFSRFDEVKVRLFQDDDEFGLVDPLFIGIEELPKPRFSYHYSVVPKIGNEDGIVSKGETVDVKFSVRNIGEGDSLRLLSVIKNKSGEGVYIRNGRVFFKEGLGKGSDASFTFTFEVKEDFDG
ncbi:MAG: PDZ domain-containing protein, partial [Deltaproteobacteria bacterium]|nr:PDZ domain-containing protein [Deltaproteobacteria bacterium]